MKLENENTLIILEQNIMQIFINKLNILKYYYKKVKKIFKLGV